MVYRPTTPISRLARHFSIKKRERGCCSCEELGDSLSLYKRLFKRVLCVCHKSLTVSSLINDFLSKHGALRWPCQHASQAQHSSNALDPLNGPMVRTSTLLSVQVRFLFIPAGCILINSPAPSAFLFVD